jgi:F-type H+-transporting ATPase subunit a
LPNGTPLVIGPLVVCIELVSYLARLVSLTVRLFANVLSGHILVEIVAGFGVTFLIR